MYCSPNDDNDDCHSLVSLMRDGVLGQYGFEELINRYGVEMHFGAHEHSYERNYPVYQYEWDASVTGQAAYVDFNKTIHIITGAAGCPENTDPWQNTSNPFSAYRIADYGYGRLHAVNSTHMFWAYQDDTKGEILDSIWIIKNQHGPFFTEQTQKTAASRQEAFDAALDVMKMQPLSSKRMTSESARKLVSPGARVF